MTSYTDKQIYSMTVDELSQTIKDKKVSIVDVVRISLARIYKYNPIVNAYITINQHDALERAHLLETELQEETYRGPLHGIPIGVKDIIFTKNMKTTMGSAIFNNFSPDINATVVDKLEAAGAIIIGKLNTHQFAYGTTGDRSFFGPVKNPHNLSKIAGGSSSGSAAAVALHLCYAALGTDTSGSVRIPAACCGVVGMKPTFGHISKYGVFPLSLQLDHIGILSKTTKDNAILLNILRGQDDKDAYSIKTEVENVARSLFQDIKGTVIGIPTKHFFDHLDPEVRRAMDHIIKFYRELGVTVTEVEIRDIEKYLNAQQLILKSDAYAVHKDRLENEPDENWDAEVKERLSLGKTEKAYEYAEALLTRQEAMNTFNYILESVDVILTPTLPILPTNINQRHVEIPGFEEENVRWALSRLTAIANFIGFPSMTLPTGKSVSGLPIGFQLIGKPNDEAKLYQFGSSGTLGNQLPVDNSIFN